MGRKMGRIGSTELQAFLQPEWSKTESITPLIIDYIKNNPVGNFPYSCINSSMFPEPERQ